eukprot:scaffold1328_cov394-Prasinococcus_capsulatus_cf.AAC.36
MVARRSLFRCVPTDLQNVFVEGASAELTMPPTEMKFQPSPEGERSPSCLIMLWYTSATSRTERTAEPRVSCRPSRLVWPSNSRRK